MKKIAILISMLLMVACAISPQQLTVTPVLAMDGEAYGNSRPVNLAVEDRRASKDIGSLGGVYADTSNITIGNDVNQAVLAAAKGKMAALGFNVNSGEVNVTTMTIVLKEINYKPLNTSMGNKIEAEVVMLAELNSQGEGFTGRYKSKTTRQYVSAPDAEDNSKMLTELISETMDRMFVDPNLKAFLINI